MKNYVMLAIAILLNIIGNHLFKYASQYYEGSWISQKVMIWSGAGFFFYFVSALFYIVSLKHIPLSVAYPCLSIAYIITIFSSKMLFNEPITTHKMAGAFIIIVGVWVLNSGAASTGS